jgi:Icc-related predicted phosphoesterase
VILVALADLHGEVSRLPAIGSDLAAADLVLVAGDLTQFGGRPDAARVVDAIRTLNPNVLGVPGNCDQKDVWRYLDDEGISLDGRHVLRDGIAFLGLGGSLPCPGRTPCERSEEDLGAHLEEACRGIPDGTPLVLVTHHPPHGTRADVARGGRHMGCQGVREFILRRRPILCVTGHIHESRCADTLEETRILNPGPLREGRYGWARIGRGVERAEIRGGACIDQRGEAATKI